MAIFAVLHYRDTNEFRLTDTNSIISRFFFTRAEFGVRIQILLDSIYDIQQDLNSNTEFGLNSGLKFRAFSTRGVTGDEMQGEINFHHL